MKIKIKSVLAAVLALTMCIGMVGCNGGGNKPPKNIDDWTNEDWDNAANQLEENYENGKKDKQDKDNKGDKSGKIKATKEIINAPMYSNKIQLGNTVFTLPITPADLISSDAVVFVDANPETTILNAPNNGVLEKTQSVKVKIDGVEYTFVFANNSKERKLLKDCKINGVPLGSYICPGGVGVGTSVDDMLKVWGEPDIHDIDTYKYFDDLTEYYDGNYKEQIISSTGNSYGVTVDLETNKVKTVFCRYNRESDDMLQFEFKEDSTNYYSTYSTPEYLNDMYYAYECNGGNYLLFDNQSSPVIGTFGYFHQWWNSHQPYELKMKEFTDEAITGAIDSYFGSKEYMKGFTYDYKIKDDSAFVIIRTANDYYGTNDGKIKVGYIGPDFKMYCLEFTVYPCNGTTEVTQEALKELDDIMFAIGDTVKVEWNR